MSKFKVGDKVLVYDNSHPLIDKGIECKILEIHNDGDYFLELTSGEDIGDCWYAEFCELKLIGKSKKQPSTTPLCYAEIQKEILDANCKVRDSIEKDLTVEIGGVLFGFDGNYFRIQDYTFSKNQAIEANKWITKMTATPKNKVVKKVVKKASKKKDLLKLSRK